MTSVFKPSNSHPHLNACLNYLPGLDGMEAACDGYREAVEALLAEVIERSGTLDTLIYPIVFDWRHHVELRLKVTFLTGHLLFEGSKATIPPHHRLDDLWRDVRTYVLKCWPDGDPGELAEVDAHIAELSRIDKDSFVFRYTLDKRGASALPSALTHIGTVEFRDVVRRVGDTLFGICAGMSEALQAHCEMEEAYSAEMRTEYEHESIDAEYERGW